MIQLKIDAVALINILRSEKEQYQRLLEIARKEQEFILEGDAKGLADVMEAMKRLMLGLRDLEEKRLTLLQADANHTATQPPPELSSVIKNFDRPAADEASKLKGELLAIITDFGEVNRTNAELLERSISYLGFQINVLVKDKSPVYGSAPVRRDVSPRLFDGRA